ncbi:MAG TPA: class I SAM-dependent methyltransferase [Candidatus Acidoferrales bacterium]|nr:class I SAM-dependent methyltransferase [Candidatus Acidoferrales bacterium]
MKVRESGMPSEELWESFFKPFEILSALGVTPTVIDAAEFGCGYGTFTIPAAKMISGKIHAVDIELGMVNAVKKHAQSSGLTNVVAVHRDFIADGTGLADASVDYVMLFNILHDERPKRILREAYRILTPGGRVGIIHWKYDSSTPRGPPMEIRPKPDQVCECTLDVGFTFVSAHDLRPYHYGFVFSKPKP